MTVVSWTLGFLRPYRRQAGAIFALSVLEFGLAGLAPWPLKVIVDYVLGGLPLPAAIADVTASGTLTPDLDGSATTDEFTQAVCQTLRRRAG